MGLLFCWVLGFLFSRWLFFADYVAGGYYVGKSRIWMPQTICRPRPNISELRGIQNAFLQYIVVVSLVGSTESCADDLHFN